MEKKIKIVHLRNSNFFGGPEKQIVNHLALLNKNKYEGILCTFIEKNKKNEVLYLAQAKNLNCYGISVSSLLDFNQLFNLVRFIKKEKVDILCAHESKSIVLGWLVKKLTNIKVVGFSRGFTRENRRIVFYEWLERRSLFGMDGIVSVSEEQKRQLEAFGINGHKMRVVHNAVAVNSHPPKLSAHRKDEIFHELTIPPKGKVVVSAGRLSPEKGHRYLVEAIGSLGEEGKGIFFIFCGDGVCKNDLEQQAKDKGVYPRCRFLGFRHDLPELLTAMDLLVLPSLTEGLPNVVLEAFASAKPVVATSVGGVPEIIEDGVDGFLVPRGHPQLLATAIIKAISAKDLSRSMGEAGFRKVKAEFTFEAQTKKLEQIYEEILASRRTVIE